MKRVLFVIDTLQTGGAEVSLLEILSRMKRYEPIICHIYPGAELKSRYEAAGIRVISLNISGHYNVSVAKRALSQVVRDTCPSVVHTTLFRADVILRLFAVAKRLPLVSSLVNNSYHRERYRKMSFPARLKLFGVQVIDGISARRVDLFVSNSESIKERSAKDLWINRDKIKVIYRGRDAAIFCGDKRKLVEALRNELGLQGRRVLLNVSRLLERKGQLDLLRAFARLVKQFPDLHLVIAGEGAFRTMLSDEITQLNISAVVTLLGNRSDVPVLLGMADLFVFPSYFEGLPGALIEAMMASVPIVASDIPENRECVDEHAASLFKPGNIDEMVEKMAQCLSNNRERESRKTNALEIATRKFEIGEVVGQYERMYDELLAR